MYFPSAPLSYAIEITYACNNACSGCVNSWKPQRQDKLYDWKTLLDRIAPPNNRRKYAEVIRITGGEPTLHPQFSQLIEYIDTFGITHATFTTGRWQQPDKILKLLQRCQHFTGLLISLHGSTPFAHHAFVESSTKAFQETCTHIERAAQAGIRVFTNTVLTQYSCEQIEEIIALSQRLGAEYAVFNRFLGPAHPLEPSTTQLRAAIILLEQLAQQGIACHLGDCVPSCFVKNSSEGSNAGIEACTISPTGWVRPDNVTHYTFGNLLEQSIEDIWQSKAAQWYRAQIPSGCFTCVKLPQCRGGAKFVTSEQKILPDRLMRQPFLEIESETLVFEPQLKPIPYFRVREEPYGYLLTRYNWAVPVSHAAKPFITALNGENTLEQLQQQFGEEILEFIGQLYQQKCVGFAERA